MNLTLKNCLYLSLVLHLSIFIFISIITRVTGIQKPFIVFGAYSKKQYHTLYKSEHTKKIARTAVPFVGGWRKNVTGQTTNRKSKINCSSRKTRSKNIPNKLKSRGIKQRNTKNSSVKSKSSKKISNPSTISNSCHKKISCDRSSILEKPKLSKKPNTKRIKKNEQSHKINADSDEKRQAFSKSKEEIKKKDLQVKQLLKTDADDVKKVEKSKEPDVVDIESKIKDCDPEKHEKIVQNQDVDSPSMKEDDSLLAKDSECKDPVCSDEDGLDESTTYSSIVLSLTGNVAPEIAFYQRCIQQEVERLWRPPLGVPKGTTCRITFFVDKKGQIDKFDIFKRSSVLIYDLSILRIAHLFKFDKKLWGKNFTVDFCQ